jgi:hypothetical protein
MKASVVRRGPPVHCRMRASSGGPFRLPGSSKEPHRPNCLCCIGPPDHAFERACVSVVALQITGVGAVEAEKFVRLLCLQGGGDAVRLSKGKAKAALRTTRGNTSGRLGPLEPFELDRMQDAVVEAYQTPSDDPKSVLNL